MSVVDLSTGKTITEAPEAPTLVAITILVIWP